MWSRCCSLFGVRLRIHPLFTMILIAAAITGHFLEITTLFGIVLIHELGHAAAAKHYGWRLREVQLTPFGGVAVTDEDGSIPAKEEAVVALSGPLMNAVMIAFAFMMEAAGIWSYAWSAYFVKANATLLLFNALPILPLDGGKLLQIGCSLLMPYYRALRITAYWSMLGGSCMLGMALTGFGAGGLELNLAMIGVFLMYSNWYVWKTIPYRFIRFLMSRGRRIGEWLRKGVLAEPIVVNRAAPLSAIVRLFKRERLHLVIVMNDRGHVLGVIPEERCTKHYLEKEQNRAVSDLFM